MIDRMGTNIHIAYQIGQNNPHDLPNRNAQRELISALRYLGIHHVRNQGLDDDPHASAATPYPNVPTDFENLLILRKAIPRLKLNYLIDASGPPRWRVLWKAGALALFRRGFYHREHMEALAQSLGVEPDIAFESNLIPLLKAVVRQGFAVTTFLRMVLEEEPDLSGVPFDPPIYLDLCVAWRRGDPLSMANRALRDFLLKERPA